MKKGLLIIVTCLLVCACSSQTNNTSGFVSSDTSDILNKISNNESFVFMITTSDCYACDKYTDISEKELVKNKVVIYVVDYDSIDDETLAQFRQILGEFSSFPVMFNMSNGKVKSTYEYSVDPEGWKKWLEKENIIQN